MYVNLYRCVYIWICHPSWIDQPDDHFMMSSKILVTAPRDGGWGWVAELWTPWDVRRPCCRNYAHHKPTSRNNDTAQRSSAFLARNFPLESSILCSRICHPSWIDQPDDHFMMSSKILVTAPRDGGWGWVAELWTPWDVRRPYCRNYAHHKPTSRNNIYIYVIRGGKSAHRFPTVLGFLCASNPGWEKSHMSILCPFKSHTSPMKSQ